MIDGYYKVDGEIYQAWQICHALKLAQTPVGMACAISTITMHGGDIERVEPPDPAGCECKGTGLIPSPDGEAICRLHWKPGQAAADL